MKQIVPTRATYYHAGIDGEIEALDVKRVFVFGDEREVGKVVTFGVSRTDPQEDGYGIEIDVKPDDARRLARWLESEADAAERGD